MPESTFLALLEREARCIAASVDGLTEHLAVSLHTVKAFHFLKNCFVNAVTLFNH